jgi:hypothetical protein
LLPRRGLTIDTPARARQLGERGGLRLSRTALAAFLIHEAEDGAWIGRAPLLADK